MPFGWNGAPANFAVFGDAISNIHAQFGMHRTDWFSSLAFASRLYVDDGVFSDVKMPIRQLANTLVWESTTLGLLGPKSLNLDKMKEEGDRGTTHTMLGFNINSEFLTITLPEAKVTGAWFLFDGLRQKAGSRTFGILELQQVRGHIEHFEASNAIWKFLTGPIDALLRYSDENAVWANCPSLEVWTAFWNSLMAVFDIMDSDDRWRAAFNGNLIRLLTPEQRLTVKLNQISSRYLDDCFVWLSADATLTTVGGLSWGGREFFRVSTDW